MALGLGNINIARSQAKISHLTYAMHFDGSSDFEQAADDNATTFSDGTDDGDFTMLYMVTPTLNDSGCFEYMDGGVVKQIDFVQNRLIWFQGKELMHRGMSPNTATPRVTVSFKVNRGIN